MLRLIVHFANGDKLLTKFSGTAEEAKRYYAIGKYFNLGTASDNMQPVAALNIQKED